MRTVTVITTILGIVMFILGIRWLRQLRRLAKSDDAIPYDAFKSPIELLFSTEVEQQEFRRQQRRTIRAFCWSGLLLFLGRVAAGLG